MITPPPVRLRAAAILLLAALALLLGGCQSRRSAPAIADGVLDLSGWSLRRDGVVHLDGAWDVYRDRLLSPHELAAAEAPARTGALVLPGSVANQSVRGQPFPDQGVVTLRLRVRGMSLDASPALRLENASVAWRLWANGNEVGSNGRVGLTRDSTIPMDTPRVVNLGPPQPQLDLVLQIANFHRGHWDIGRVDLGEASSIETRHSVWIAANLGIFGALLALGIYHIALFLLQRRALEPALVAAICIGWGIRIPVDGMAGKVWGPLAAWLPYRAILFIENS